MQTINLSLVRQMRKMALEGRPASCILKELYAHLPANQRNLIGVMEHFKKAFCLSLHEVKPIAGWELDGTGEIQNDRLDELLEPALAKHQPEWALETRV